jgi:hypothetical protein
MDRFAKDHLLFCATGQSPSNSTAGPIVDVARLESLLYIGRKRFDWFELYTSFNHGVNSLFGAGATNPYLRLFDRADRLEYMRRFKRVRDHVAHGGEEARDLYEKHVLGDGVTYIRPGKWLASSTGSGAIASDNFEVVIANVRNICLALTLPPNSPMDQIDTLLGKTKGSAGVKGPAGNYTCGGCQTTLEHPSWSTLPRRCSEQALHGGTTETTWHYQPS